MKVCDIYQSVLKSRLKVGDTVTISGRDYVVAITGNQRVELVNIGGHDLHFSNSRNDYAEIKYGEYDKELTEQQAKDILGVCYSYAKKGDNFVEDLYSESRIKLGIGYKCMCLNPFSTNYYVIGLVGRRKVTLVNTKGTIPFSESPIIVDVTNPHNLTKEEAEILFNEKYYSAELILP